MNGERGPDVEWVVLLEAAGEMTGGVAVDPMTLGRIVAPWASSAPVTLCSSDRYALQLKVWAESPHAALASAMGLWRDALRRTDLPDWELVRAEIVTPEELEHELRAAEQAGYAAAGYVPPRNEDARLSDDLLRSALYDALTGLPNREVFVDHVRRSLGRPAAHRPVHAVLSVDVGVEPCDMPPSPGAHLPDDIVIEAARRLLEAVRNDDVLARVGPHQFALLVEVPDGSDVEGVAARIVETVRSPRRRGHAADLRASVGVATVRGDDADEVIWTAEAAMEAAGIAGSDRYACSPADPVRRHDGGNG